MVAPAAYAVAIANFAATAWAFCRWVALVVAARRWLVQHFLCCAVFGADAKIAP
jgi:hypothetical protein